MGIKTVYFEGLVLGLVIASCVECAKAQTSEFYLREGDTVVFFGDSITEQSYYAQYVQLYTETRFPHMDVRFIYSGVGGDKVSGGSGGSIETRLTRDVISYKPSVVTIMLGMNDGLYRPLDKEIATAYRNGYAHILERLHKELPEARITILGPSPFDEVTRPELVHGGYNRTLNEFVKIDEELAKLYGATFINLHLPVAQALQRASDIDNQAAQFMTPDRIHPATMGHWIMAAAILKCWNAPDLVTSITIDSQGVSSRDLIRSNVTALQKVGDVLTWNEVDDALPLPRMPDAEALFLQRVADVDRSLNREPVKVSGLSQGLYKLTIDGKSMGSFTEEELAQGVDLAGYDTPMRKQAQAASWIVRDYATVNYTHLRLLIDGPSVRKMYPDSESVFHSFEALELQRIDQAVQPKPHQFKLEPDSVSR